jgi:hypothetical protein
LVVPSKLADAPLLAVAGPDVSSGGQYVAHCPVQVEADDVSATHRYSVRPAASTRYVPTLPLVVLIAATAPAAGALPAAAEVGADGPLEAMPAEPVPESAAELGATSGAAVPTAVPDFDELHAAITSAVMAAPAAALSVVRRFVVMSISRCSAFLRVHLRHELTAQSVQVNRSRVARNRECRPW